MCIAMCIAQILWKSRLVCFLALGFNAQLQPAVLRANASAARSPNAGPRSKFDSHQSALHVQLW